MKYNIGDELIVDGNSTDVLGHFFSEGERVSVFDASSELVKGHTIYLCYSLENGLEQSVLEEDLKRRQE